MLRTISPVSVLNSPKLWLLVLEYIKIVGGCLKSLRGWSACVYVGLCVLCVFLKVCVIFEFNLGRKETMYSQARISSSPITVRCWNPVLNPKVR